MSDLPPLVDAAWVQERLGEPDLLLGDCRGPNAHQRGHLPGSVPLVLGAPPPLADRETVQEFAVEVQRRLGRHGVDGSERLVLYDRGDCVGAAASAQAAALAGHPRVSVLAGGFAAWPGEIEQGAVELQKTKAALEPRPEAVPTWQELEERLGDATLTILDVRTPEEYTGKAGSPCDPRQGHIPGARLLEHHRLLVAPGPAPPGRRGARDRGPARGSRDRRVLPLRVTLGARRAGPARRGVRRAQLPGLVARMVAPRAAAHGALRGSRAGAPQHRSFCYLCFFFLGGEDLDLGARHRPEIGTHARDRLS